MHKIAFYCSSTSWGGLEMNTLRYAQWMQEEGFEVEVFCVANSPIHLEAQAFNLEITNIHRNRKYFDVVNAFRIANLFREKQINTVWFRDTRDMDLLSWAKLFSGKKWKLLYQQAMQLGVDKKDLFHTLRFRSIDFWIATLDFLKNQVLLRTRVNPNSMYTIPLGVDASLLQKKTVSKEEARKRLDLPPNEFIVGMIGRIDPLKGQHTLINAVLLSHGAVHAVIMGESTKNEGNQYELDIKQKVRSLALKEFVHFRPYSKDVQDFYAAIDVFVMASQGETFGTVTIEAMSFGLPIVGTNSSGTPELLNFGKCGLLFEPDNARELSEHISHLKSNPLIAEDLGIKSKKRFDLLYSKEASVKAISKLIR